MNQQRRRLLLLLASLGLVEGCMTWKQRPLSAGAAPVLSTERPVRVTRIDRSVIVVQHPRIDGDSLVGDVGNPPERVAIALGDVQSIHEESVSVLRTCGAALERGRSFSSF